MPKISKFSISSKIKRYVNQDSFVRYINRPKIVNAKVVIGAAAEALENTDGIGLDNTDGTGLENTGT